VQIVENLEGETNSIGCNKLWLRSGRVISPEERNIHEEHDNEDDIQPVIKPSTVVIKEETTQGKNTIEKHNPNENVISPPLFFERMMIEKPTVYSNFDIVEELKNQCVKIPLL
jgi:hypothetical protein